MLFSIMLFLLRVIGGIIYNICDEVVYLTTNYLGNITNKLGEGVNMFIQNIMKVIYKSYTDGQQHGLDANSAHECAMKDAENHIAEIQKKMFIVDTGDAEIEIHIGSPNSEKGFVIFAKTQEERITMARSLVGIPE